MIPAISTNSPLAALIPLLFIVCVGVIKELVVEIKRWNDSIKQKFGYKPTSSGQFVY